MKIPKLEARSRPVHPLQPASRSQQFIDLTGLTDQTDEPIAPLGAQEDHMSSLIELIRPRPEDNDSSSTPPRKSRAQKPQKATAPKNLKRKASNISSSHASPRSPPSTSFKNPFGVETPDLSKTPTTASPSTPATSRKPHRTPFAFLNLPPELRNRVYSLLLTHACPIELPDTRKTAAVRSAKFAQCHSKRQRQAFKTIFLEILSTSRQVHAEATGILYGSNIFKFRSDHGEKPKPIPFPAKYLPLLRHVKVSVISREQNIEQDKVVAQLLQNFTGARLEDFEMTWFGWSRYRLQNEGVLCKALLALHVDRVFAVKILGQARMERAMLEELETRCGARKVCIERPVVVVMRNGRKVEVSDDEAGP